MWKIGRIWLWSLWRLLVPRCCVVCGNTLQEGEEVVCLRCNMDLPRTGYHLKPDNPVERALWAKMPLVRASSYVYYRRGGSYASVLHLLKYKGRKDIALSLASWDMLDRSMRLRIFSVSISSLSSPISR